MTKTSLAKKIKNVRQSIIAVGFKPAPNKVTIIGSGFSISSKGEILSAAHLYNQVKPEHRKKLVGLAMTKQEPDGLEKYAWLPLKLMKKNEKKDDMALFKIESHERTLLTPLELGNSDKVMVGQDVYFIGFPYAAKLMNEGFGISLIVNKSIICNIKVDGQDPKHPRNFIFLDTISNPGNSGSPLLDLKTNKVIGVMAITFRTQSKTQPKLDIREPMHICAAKPINLAKSLL